MAIGAEIGDRAGADADRRRQGPRPDLQRGDRGGDLGQRPALVAQRGLQRVAGRQHRGGLRRVARLDGQQPGGAPGGTSPDSDTWPMWNSGPRVASTSTGTGTPLGAASSLAGRVGVVERQSVDADRDAALVIAVAVQRRGQPPDIAAGPRHQGERPDRRLFLQADERRGIVQRRVERRVAGGLDGRWRRAAGRPRARGRRRSPEAPRRGRSGPDLVARTVGGCRRCACRRSHNRDAKRAGKAKPRSCGASSGDVLMRPG